MKQILLLIALVLQNLIQRSNASPSENLSSDKNIFGVAENDLLCTKKKRNISPKKKHFSDKNQKNEFWSASTMQTPGDRE